MARELGVCSVRASSSLLMRCVLGRWDRGWHLITWASMQCHLLLKHEGLGYQAWQGLCTTGVGSPSFRGKSIYGKQGNNWFGVGGCSVYRAALPHWAWCFCSVLTLEPLSSREAAVVLLAW